MIFGTLYTVGGFGLAAGTWSAGWIFDATGSYAGALWLGLVMAALSPLLMWIVARRRLPRRAGSHLVMLAATTSDMGRRWLILGTIFVNLAVIYGAWYAYSVFLVALLKEFGWSRSVVAGGFSIFVMFHGSLSPVIGSVAARTGPRRMILVGTCTLGAGLFLASQTTEWWHLYLAFGGVTAAGISMSGWLPSVLCVRGWFPSQVGTAVGIASAGIGVGISLLVPFTQYLIDWIGWRWAMRILAVLIVGWVLPATLWLIRDPDSLEAPTTARPRRGPSESVGALDVEPRLARRALLGPGRRLLHGERGDANAPRPPSRLPRGSWRLRPGRGDRRWRGGRVQHHRQVGVGNALGPGRAGIVLHLRVHLHGSQRGGHCSWPVGTPTRSFHMCTGS